MRGAALALILCGAAIGAGCGEDSPGSDPDAPDDASATELEITVSVDATAPDPAEAMVAAVTCPGDEPAVCDAVAAIPDDPGAPVDPATPCTEIYGGPDSMTVTGTLRRGADRRRLLARERLRDRALRPLRGSAPELFPSYQPGSAIGA